MPHTRTERAVRRRSAGYQLAFFSDITLGNIFSHCIQHSSQLFRVAPKAFPRLAGVLALSLLMAPFRVWERVRWGRTISRTRLPDEPLFVIGHWRSGTTHLHNLLSADARFGCLTNLHATIPESFLSWERPARWLLSRVVPARRPMDNMSLGLDDPQECEIALSKVDPHTFYAHLLNPRDMRDQFESSILLQSVTEQERRKFADRYVRLVRKVTISSGDRPLVLKNPANTGRLQLIHEAFPECRFVFIHRNPYDVFASMQHFYETLFPMLQMQGTSENAITELILEGYVALHSMYLDQRAKLGSNRVVEVGFDELEQGPIDVARHVYMHCNREFSEPAEAAMRTYLESVRGYQKNPYMLPATTIQQINDRWAFAFDRWGYERQIVSEDPASALPPAAR